MEKDDKIKNERRIDYIQELESSYSPAPTYYFIDRCFRAGWFFGAFLGIGYIVMVCIMAAVGMSSQIDLSCLGLVASGCILNLAVHPVLNKGLENGEFSEYSPNGWKENLDSYIKKRTVFKTLKPFFIFIFMVEYFAELYIPFLLPFIIPGYLVYVFILAYIIGLLILKAYKFGAFSYIHTVSYMCRPIDAGILAFILGLVLKAYVPTITLEINWILFAIEFVIGISFFFSSKVRDFLKRHKDVKTEFAYLVNFFDVQISLPSFGDWKEVRRHNRYHRHFDPENDEPVTPEEYKMIEKFEHDKKLEMLKKEHERDLERKRSEEYWAAMEKEEELKKKAQISAERKVATGEELSEEEKRLAGRAALSDQKLEETNVIRGRSKR